MNILHGICCPRYKTNSSAFNNENQKMFGFLQLMVSHAGGGGGGVMESIFVMAPLTKLNGELLKQWVCVQEFVFQLNITIYLIWSFELDISYSYNLKIFYPGFSNLIYFEWFMMERSVSWQCQQKGNVLRYIFIMFFISFLLLF